jgi:O-succinylbenzoic acid--CoA ligase
MKNSGQIFHIAGNSFDKPGLISICLEKISVIGTPAWEREIWSFIHEWLSPSSYIEVQTSGSTGKPKTISLLKKHMEASAKATIDFLKLSANDSALLCLPVKYIAGKMMIVRALTGGINLFFTEPSATPDLSALNQISFSAMVPLQVANLLQNNDGKTEINKIQKLLIGGSFLPDGLEDQLQNVKSECWQTYGMTETITHIALRKLNGTDAGDWYKPLPGLEIEVDTRGCLMINAPQIGVKQLHTNDLAGINERGEFKIIGRSDNVIVSGGVKLSPESIEKKLQGVIPGKFFIGSLPDKKLGEQLILLIEDTGKVNRTVFHIWKSIEERLKDYEIPKEIFFLKKFTKTGNGKIMRSETLKGLKNSHQTTNNPFGG